MEFKKISNHEINISHTNNGGCIVKVGCGRFAYSTPAEMLADLKEFYKDPRKMEKEYNSINGPEPEMVECDARDEERPQTRRDLPRAPRGPLGPALANRAGVTDAFTEADENF